VLHRWLCVLVEISLLEELLLEGEPACVANRENFGSEHGGGGGPECAPLYATQLNKRSLEMAEARYMRRMKRLHQGPSPFDPSKTPAFNARSLPTYPDVDSDGRTIWCGLGALHSCC
jgi:hypothetical protein